jgi:signal peptidase I
MPQKLVRLTRTLKPVVIALALVLAMRTVAAEPYSVPSGSMVPTLLIGDHIVASKFAYGWGKYSAPLGLMPDFSGRLLGRAPARGDVVVFRLPRDARETYVKRVIGLPGDRIRMEGGRLVVNGAALPRREAGSVDVELDNYRGVLLRYVETMPGGREHDILEISDRQPLDDMAEVTVPPHSYFMMGDNRDDSLDSRVPASEGGVGFVPEENLIGRVDLVLFSTDPDVSWWHIGEWPRALRIARFFGGVR